MSDNRSPVDGAMGVFAVGMVVCCGVPLLLGAGVAVSAIGLTVGSIVVVAAGVGLAAWGWRRWQHDQRCDMPGEDARTECRDDVSHR